MHLQLYPVQRLLGIAPGIVGVIVGVTSKKRENTVEDFSFFNIH